MSKKPTLEYRIPEENKIVVEFRYTPFVCSDMFCRYSDDAVVSYILNPIPPESLICSKCGGKLRWDYTQKEFIQRFENKIY